MAVEAKPTQFLSRIASHRPMHDVPRSVINLISNPVLLVFVQFVLCASFLNDVLLHDDNSQIPSVLVIYVLFLAPAGFLLHYLTTPCSVDEASVLAKVAHEDGEAGPYVRRWIAPDRTPSTTEFRLVEAYLRDRGFLSGGDSAKQSPLYLARHLAGDRRSSPADCGRTD